MATLRSRAEIPAVMAEMTQEEKYQYSVINDDLEVTVDKIFAIIKKEKEQDVSKKEILQIANEKFGDLEGIAQQYLFYWRRELG